MLRILQIDTETPDREAVQATLRAAWKECEVYAAATRHETLALLQQHTFDLVLAEVNVPGLEAIQVLDVVQGRAPVVFLTRHGSQELAVRALKQGAADYLVKSADYLMRLPSQLQDVLKTQRLAHQVLVSHRVAQNAAGESHFRAMTIGLHRVLAEVEKYLSAPSLDTVLRAAVEFLRDEVGLERCSLALVDAEGSYLQGSYGTNLRGETTDEHESWFPVDASPNWLKAVQELRAAARPWIVQESVPLFEWNGEYAVPLERDGWVVGTPLLSDGAFIGILFNDTACSGAPLDEMKQELTAVFCSLLAHIIERKRAEEQVSQREQMLHTLFAHFPQGSVHVFDRDFRYLLAEGESLRQLGLEPADLVGRTLTELYEPHVLEVVAEPFQRAFAGEAVSFEASFNGREFDVNTVPLCNEQGQVHAIMSVARDVTAARAFRIEQQKFASLVENSDDFIAIADLDGRLTYINSAGRALIGIEDGTKVLPDDLFECLAPANPDFRQTACAGLETQGRWEGAGTLYHLSGSHEIEVHAKLFYVTDPHNGQPVSIATVAQDVRLQRQMEQQLHENEARFRRLTRSNIMGVLVVELEGEILEANDYFLHMLGYSRAEIENGRLNWKTLTPVEFLTISERAIAQLRETATAPPYEKAYVHKDGHHVPVLVGATLLEGSNDRCLVFVLDLSARKSLEQEMQSYATRLEQSNRELQSFAYVASHDLQEPLRKIEAFSERLSEDFSLALDATGRDYLQRMQRSATRMRALITELLTLSRISTQEQALRPLDLSEVVNDVLADLEIQLRETGAQVKVEALPVLEADAVQMRQLMQNLVGNALKFRKATDVPQIRITSRILEAQNACHIEVQDNGIGFDSQYAEQIFAPFGRLHGRAQYDGTGMGLAICRRIAERHGGTITAQSTLGQGATFILTLPLNRKTM
jgi:PAS domain S-box-containing protein